MVAVSFDVWGTLLDVSEFFEMIATEIASSAKKEPSYIKEQVKAIYPKLRQLRIEGCISDDDVVEQCLNLLAEDLGVRKEIIRRAIARTLLYGDFKKLPIPKALDVVRTLSFMNVKLAVLGNVIYWPGAYNRLILEKLGFSEYLYVQIYADEIKCSKPRKEAFLRVCEVLRIRPRDLIHVGDNLYEDFLGALHAGSRAVLIDSAQERSVSLRDVGYIVPSITYVPSIVQAILKSEGLNTCER